MSGLSIRVIGSWITAWFFYWDLIIVMAVLYWEDSLLRVRLSMDGLMFYFFEIPLGFVHPSVELGLILGSSEYTIHNCYRKQIRTRLCVL